MFNGLNNKLANVPTITGLSNVTADEIITDDLIVNGIDIGTAIADLQQITTGITYDSLSDTTTVDNNVSITKTLNVTSTVTAPTFDGTATKVNLANTATGATNYLVMSTTNSGSSNLITDDSGAMYNSTTNTATINITGRAGSVSVLEDDSANTRYVTFIEGTFGSQTVRCDVSSTPLAYRPDNSTLTASTFNGKAMQVNVLEDNTSNTFYPAFVNGTGAQTVYCDNVSNTLTYRPDIGQLTTERLYARQNSQVNNMFLGSRNSQSIYISSSGAGLPNAGGDFNVAIGGQNALTLDGGSNNFSMGYNCMLANKLGSNNCFMGHRSGYSVGFPSLLANFNTGVGDSTLENVLDTVETTAIGAFAGNTIATSSFRNTCIGARTNCGGGLSYATAIGAEANVTTSNTVQLGRNVDNVNCPNTLSVASNVTASTAPTLGGHLCNKTYVDSAIGAYTGFVTTNTVQNITANKTFYGASLLIDDGTGDNTSISQVNQITVFENNNLVNTTTTITGLIPATSLNKIIPTDGSNPTSAQILQTTVTGANIPLQNNRYYVTAHTYNFLTQLTTFGQPAGQVLSLYPLTIGMFITSSLGTNFSNGTYITSSLGGNVYTINQPALNASLFKINHNLSMITTNISLASATTAGTINFRNDGAFQFLCNNTSGTEIMPLQINSTDVQVNASLTVNNACMYGRDDQFAFTSVPSGAPTQPIGYTVQYSETAVTFTSGTVFNYTTVLPLLDNGVWLVNGTLTLNQGTGSYSGSPYLYIRLVTATGSDFYPTTGNGNRVILPTSSATPVVAPFVSTLIVKSATQVRAAIQGQIVMTVGTATKALNVAFTKIA